MDCTEQKGDIPKTDYFRVKNDWFDALIARRIPGEQRQCLDLIIRKTYGWRCKKAAISLTEFQRATGIKRSNVVRALHALRKSRIIGIKRETTSATTYWFNKYFNEWKVVSKAIPSLKSDTSSSITFDNPTFKRQLNNIGDNSDSLKKDTTTKYRQYNSRKLSDEDKIRIGSEMASKRLKKYKEKHGIK